MKNINTAHKRAIGFLSSTSMGVPETTGHPWAFMNHSIETVSRHVDTTDRSTLQVSDGGINVTRVEGMALDALTETTTSKNAVENSTVMSFQTIFNTTVGYGDVDELARVEVARGTSENAMSFLTNTSRKSNLMDILHSEWLPPFSTLSSRFSKTGSITKSIPFQSEGTSDVPMISLLPGIETKGSLSNKTNDGFIYSGLVDNVADFTNETGRQNMSSPTGRDFDSTAQSFLSSTPKFSDVTAESISNLNASLYNPSTTSPYDAPYGSTDITFNLSNATMTSFWTSTAVDISDAMQNVNKTSRVFGVGIVSLNGNDASNPTIMAAKAVVLTLLALGGVIGNAFVIWSVVRQRHLHRPPFYYLLSLSLTDLSRAAFCLPLVLMTLLQGSVWRHGDSACDLLAFANSFFVLSSGVSMLVIAADRHLSLVYAHIYRRRAGGAVNLVVVLLSWTLAFLVAFPPVVGVGAYAFEASEAQCTLRHKSYRQDNDTLGFLMVFSGLTGLTLFLYHRIFVALRAHRKMRPLQHEPARSTTWTFVGPGANGQAFVNWANGFGWAPNPGGLPNLARNPPRPNIARVVSLYVTRNQHVTRLFFLMTLTFHALWFPYQVLSYWRVFGDLGSLDASFVTVSAWFSYAQVALCPVVYFMARGSTRRKHPKSEGDSDDKQEYLLESINRK